VTSRPCREPRSTTSRLASSVAASEPEVFVNVCTTPSFSTLSAMTSEPETLDQVRFVGPALRTTWLVPLPS
jgi:hypothetical protein